MQDISRHKPMPFPLSLVNHHWLDFAVQSIMPTWSTTRIHARVLDKIQETSDVISLVLDPNSHWGGFQAGQFVLLRIRIDGVIHERCYSLSSVADGPVRLTIKRVSGGRVSSYIHDSLEIGAIVELSPAQGEFVWQPPRKPTPLLLVAGGIGITPLYSIAATALQADADQDIVLLYYARSKQDFVFRAALEALAQRGTSMRLLCIARTADSDETLTARSLRTMVPDHAQRLTYCCGPESLLQAMEEIYAAGANSTNLRVERFGAAQTATVDAAGTQTVHLLRSGQALTGQANTILELAEAHGVPVKSGCRMGICNTCRCRKASGPVLDLKTGQVNDDPNTEIRLCSTRAVGPVELEL